MSEMLKSYSLFMGARGVQAIIFGILALVWPQEAMLTLIRLFGIYAVVDGILALLAGIAADGYFSNGWIMAAGGLAAVIIGLFAMLWPDSADLSIIYLVAVKAMIIGVCEILIALELHKVFEVEWLMALEGLFSILFGGLLFTFPVESAMGLVWMIGIYALFSSVLLISDAIRMRGLQQEFVTAGSPAA